jgi:hypothetical protein
MSYEINLKTGFFKTCKYSLDFQNTGIKLCSIKKPADEDIVIPWEMIYEVSFVRVNDNMVEMDIQSSDASYVGSISSQNQAVDMSRILKDTFKVKVHVE